MARTINDEQSLNISGTFTATGTSDENFAQDGDFNLSLSGTFLATVELQRSFDEKSTWVTVDIFTTITEKTGSSSTRNRLNVPVAYRLECTTHTSGTVIFVVNQ